MLQAIPAHCSVFHNNIKWLGVLLPRCTTYNFSLGTWGHMNWSAPRLVVVRLGVFSVDVALFVVRQVSIMIRAANGHLIRDEPRTRRLNPSAKLWSFNNGAGVSRPPILLSKLCASRICCFKIGGGMSAPRSPRPQMWEEQPRLSSIRIIAKFKKN